MPTLVTSPLTEPFHLRTVSFSDPTAQELVAEANAYNAQLYGHADATPIDASEFDPDSGGLFVIAQQLSTAVGCAGYRRADDQGTITAEVKRLYVRPEARRSGAGRFILAALERHASAAGYTRIILDVGGKQSPAHALYEEVGYHRISGFSIYRDRPGNRAYGKTLSVDIHP
jgi:GNAT superfamily N-acetyltransferase